MTPSRRDKHRSQIDHLEKFSAVVSTARRITDRSSAMPKLDTKKGMSWVMVGEANREQES
jgi:hypothetical protein